MKYKIRCTHCNQIEQKNIVQCSRCSGSLETEIMNSANINIKEKNVFLRYKCFLPVENTSGLSKYPNNNTPIIELQRKSTFVKLEYCSFSQSSKDREAFIEIIMSRQLGYKGVAVASTGNMGASLASLSALFQLPCYIFIPEDTSAVKIQQIQQYGGYVKLVSGTYDDIVPEVKAFARKEDLFLASLQAFRFDGYKTISYEIYESFGNKIPSNVVVPLGDGTTYVSIWKGFKDLLKARLIEKMPHLIGVQANNSNPIAQAFTDNTPVKIMKKPQTIAKAIRIGDPLDGTYSLKVAQETKGKILSYTDTQILEAQKLLLKEGINAEYASALTYCPVIYHNLQDSLLLITGSGLKN